MSRLFCFLCLVAIAAVLGSSAGCSRQHYRMKADREVYSILRQGNNDPRWQIDDYRIAPNPESRMFVPFHPDREPMPFDDPAAHQKMHRVAGMKGSRHWYEHGRTQTLENPKWQQFLLLNEKGEVPLDRDKAIELARLHSPEYQAALENLYLTAMAVSRQRFRYDVQFFGGDSLSYTTGARSGSADSRGSPRLRNETTIGADRALATGGTWVVDLANTVTWTLTGQGAWSATSLINAGLTQPLLRGASRKVVLESLTQAERDFLVAVRQMVLFQQGHYTRIVSGASPMNTGAPSGASRANVPSLSGGFYGLLAEQIRIQNQRQNIIGMGENLSRFMEMFDANQVSDVTQIEETRQNLFSAQSRLMTQINRYQGNIETYIRSLGLPPELADSVNISDPLLEQFQLTSPGLTVLMEDVADLLAIIRKKDEPLSGDFRARTRDVVRRAGGEIIILGQDLDILQRSMPERIRSLKSLENTLAKRIESGERIEIDPRIYSTDVFEERITKLRTKDIQRNLSRLQAIFTLLGLFASTEEQELREMIQNYTSENPVFDQLMFDQPALDALHALNIRLNVNESDDSIEADLLRRQQELEKLTDQLNAMRATLNLNETSDGSLRESQRLEARIEARRIIAELEQKDEYRIWIRRVFSAFQNELVLLSLMQTRTRLDSMTLMPVAATADEAFRSASEHRLDWMNRKSQLVDEWRKIDITADALKGVLDLSLNATTGTVDRRGVHFGRDNSEIRVGLNWTSPLNRYNQMMDYRENQIAYQNARRNYYLYVDSVHAELRNIVRNLQMSRINFEINRNAVLVGTVRVDVMQLRMEQPPQRGGIIDTNTAQLLINALNGLLGSQNDLLDTWVDYQTQRMLLDFGMGTMQLDDRGRWIDPGTIGSIAAPAPTPTHTPSVVPLPLPLDRIEAPRPNRRYVEEE